MVRPIDGLVVAKQALLDAEIARPDDKDLRERFLGYVVDGAITNVMACFADVLQLGPDRWRDTAALGDAFVLAVPDTQQVLRPTAAIARDASSPPVALLWDLPPGLALDERETVTGDWDYPPSAKFDRLLRHVGVPIGLLTNRTHIRLMYAPHGASTGAMTFRIADLVAPAGRPLLDAFVMLLHARQWFGVAPDKQLPRLLAASREAQGRVTKELADQVLEALHVLLAGFEAADGGEALRRAYADPDRGGDHIYAGLLTFMLRLVFVLYAEDNGLLPVEHPLYAEHLSVLGLHDELAADAGAFPDAMARRYGAYGRLVALFRAIFFGVSHGQLVMPPRHGELFSPHVYPFLEGVTEPSSPAPHDIDGRRRVTIPAIADETVYLVLHSLLYLGDERLSYKALDVEQIGSVYEALMGFSVEQLAAPAVCLKKSRTWVTGEQLAAEQAGARGKWLADELGLAKADADKIAKAVGKEHKPAAIVEALAPFATTNPPKRDAGRYVIQPGAERRRSGSHYTPRSLTAPIVEKTLAPLLAALGPAPTSEQLLSLKICDPAMGSGAFLVEVVRQLGDHVVAAWRREGKEQGLLPAHGPAHGVEDAVPIARRLVAQRCVYGVDKNPHAVTLAKLSLWLVTLAKDKPFTFVDHSLRHGDSLVGLDLEQILAFHWEPGAQLDAIEQELRQVLDEAVASRERIVSLAIDDSPAAQREKERLLRDAEDAVGRLRLIADLVLGAFFSSIKPKEREAERVRRRDLIELWLKSGRDFIPGELAELATEFRTQVPAYHWMIELPEVFWAKRKDPLNKDKLDGSAWIDAFVGNPPFMGKNGIAALPGGDALLDWLKQVHPGSHGNADYVAHFFRRAGYLLGDHGTLGLIATNTIAQGDTRSTGLQWLVGNGATIYDATRTLTWPGEAAVTVSVVHCERGRCTSPVRMLDGVRVEAINSRLRAGQERPDPVALEANAEMSFIGCYVLGMGFVLTPEQRDAFIAKNKKNAERIFPYLGGEEVNTSPTQSFDRYVIRFGDMTLEEANRWPDLLDKVRRDVKPERDQLNDNADGRRRKQFWWRFGRETPAMFAALAKLDRCLVIPQQYPNCVRAVFQPTDRVLSQKLIVIPSRDFFTFAVIQSAIHDSWTNLFCGRMGAANTPVYSPADCLGTFPFPIKPALATLEAIGEQLYTARARFMVETNQGLTTTYNQLKDPDCDSDRIDDIRHLRALHEDLDRAVLAAYGWSDIVVPPYCPTTDTDRAAAALFEDLVIDRLFALNAERAAQENKAQRPTRIEEPKVAKKQRKPRGVESQTTMLDDTGAGAKIIPLRPRAPTYLQTATRIDPADAGANSWARPRTNHEGEVTAALAAVLKTLTAPSDRRQVRLATLLCLEPHLLAPLLDSAAKKSWVRAVGREAKRSMTTPVDETVEHWGAAVRALRSRGRLIEDADAATWGAGEGLDALDVRGWPESRAAFVVSQLGRVVKSADFDTVIIQFPSAIRELVNRAA